MIVNQPGASGSIGTKNALEPPKDGYTWTAGAAKDLGTYIVSGLLDTKIGDWRLYLSVINVSVLGVNPDAPYKTPSDLDCGHEGEAGPSVGGDRRRQLVGPRGDRGLHARARPHLQACHL